MAKQSFVTGQVLTAQQVNDLQTNDFNQTVSAKTASYTLVAADKGTRITMSSTSATTITVNNSLFSAGDTLFIQNLNTGVSTITAGTATVTTASSLALAQWEGGTLYFTSASAAIFFKSDGAAAGGGGKVLQVVQGTYSTATSNNTSTLADTGLTASITPSLNTSKVLILLSQNGVFKQLADTAIPIKLFRGATEISQPSVNATYNGAADRQDVGTVSIAYLDEPATTSATTYKTQFSNSNGGGNNVIVQHGNAMSSIILMEIGA